MKNVITLFLVPALLLSGSLACSRFALRDVNLFEGNNAADAAAQIRTKIGVDSVKVISAEVRKNQMKITIQAPNNPKNMDEYTFEKGYASGPKPVEVFSIGNLDMTADKYHLTDMSEINFAAISNTVVEAIALSKLDGAEVDVITMDQQKAEMTNPSIKEDKKRDDEDLKKQIKAKQDECFGQSKFPAQCIEELMRLQKRQVDATMGKGQVKWDLAWRIFIQSPRGRKDFWADKQGKLIENPY